MKSKNPEDPRKPSKKSAKPAASPPPVEPKARATPKAPAKKPAQKATAPAPRATRPKASSKIGVRKIPAILLEGDGPTPLGAGGPGRRYVLGPDTSASTATMGAPADLPESYGTGALILAARDPHWVYAHWDFTREEIRNHNRLSADGHLILRIYRGGGDVVSEIHVHPESRNWFVPVPQGGTRYAGELGYRDHQRKWVSLARSSATLTPPEGSSSDTTVTFATIPPDVPFMQLVASVKTVLRQNRTLVEALRESHLPGLPDFSAPKQTQAEWTPVQQEAVARAVSMDSMRRVWIGSVEITELVRRQLAEQTSSLALAEAGRVAGAPGPERIGAAGEASSVTSPAEGFAPGRRPKGFWFNINAELVVYGSTEPDARVLLGDRQIRLRPDGSFSFRFALPDGEFSLPATAQSADGEDTREAKLKFARGTTYQGEVGKHAQDSRLKAPSPEAAS